MSVMWSLIFMLKILRRERERASLYTPTLLIPLPVWNDVVPPLLLLLLLLTDSQSPVWSCVSLQEEKVYCLLVSLPSLPPSHSLSYYLAFPCWSIFLFLLEHAHAQYHHHSRLQPHRFLQPIHCFLLCSSLYNAAGPSRVISTWLLNPCMNNIYTRLIIIIIIVRMFYTPLVRIAMSSLWKKVDPNFSHNFRTHISVKMLSFS